MLYHISLIGFWYILCRIQYTNASCNYKSLNIYLICSSGTIYILPGELDTKADN